MDNQTKVRKLKCSGCKLEKSADQFPGFNTGRPGYRCIDCASDDRVRAKYRKQISEDPMEVSEFKLQRKYMLAKMYEDELERFKNRAKPKKSKM